MIYIPIAFFSFSVLIAGIIGLIRFNKIDPVYYPFIFCMWIAGFNELLSYTLIRSGSTTSINNNIYILIESLLITWQFKKWDLFDQYGKMFSLTIVLVSIAWLFENIGISSIYKVGVYFRVFYAFIIILMSIHRSTWVIVNGRGIVFKNPMFLICLGYIVFFTYKIVTDAFWFYGINVSNAFSIDVFIIFTWINLFVNLLFGIAILWIPLKPRYISF